MNRVARSSLIIAFFFAVDKILSFIRQIYIARLFNLSYQIDAFNAANNIPDLLSALISGGALGMALIPVLSEYIQKYNRTEAWKLFIGILNLAFLATASLSILIAIFAKPLVCNLIVPNFPPEQQALTIQLMRLNLIAILVFSISGLVMSALQANQHFITPALAPIFYNIGQLFGIMILAPKAPVHILGISLPAIGLGIFGLVYGVIFGSLLHLTIQIPGLIRYGFRWGPHLNFRHPGMRKMFLLVGPRILTMLFLQMYFIARDNIASGLGEGSIAVINYGWFIMQVPETLIGSAVAIAILPTLSEQIACNNMVGFQRTVNNAVRIIFSLTIPSAALLAIVLPSLVGRIFGFSESDTNRIVSVTQVYLIGLTGHSLLEIATRAFYAMQDAKTPFLASALNTIIFSIFSFLLSRFYSSLGIAFATTISFTGEALFLLHLLNFKLPTRLSITGTLCRVIIGTAISTAISFLLLSLPLSTVPLTVGILLLGMITILFFVWPEIKLFFHS